MKSFAYLLAVLPALPVFAQEPAPPPVFDLRSEAIREVIRDTAATQYANVQETIPASAETGSDELVYVPPERRAPVEEAKVNLPDPPPASDGFLSQVFSIVLEEALGIEDDDGITTSNDMLRCRVQKETKSSPPGVDNCPTVY